MESQHKNIGKPQSASEVTTRYAGYEALLTCVNNYRKIRTADSVILKRVLKERPYLLIRVPLEVLLSVMALKAPTREGISKDLRMDNRTVKRGVEHLLRLGYIAEVESPRIIWVFNKHKIDRGYVVTDSGLRALQEIIGV